MSLRARGLATQMCALGIALCVLAPVLNLLWTAAGGSLAHWGHLARFVLPAALQNTLALLAGVGVVVVLIGTACAWLVTAYEFPGRRMLTWALLLPLAVPTYIMAFAYLDLLHPIGPIQTAIRTVLGYDSPRQFRLGDLRSIWGAIFLLGMVLYPYVYLSTRAMFMTQAANLMEAARTLGASPVGAFARVALPLARPAIAVGLSLALLEALNDIGASEFLGVQTLTVSVYTTWVTRSDLAGAAQIALSMLVIVVGLILFERHQRKQQRYATTQRMRPMARTRLTGVRAGVAMTLGWLPVIFGFVAPALYLLAETVKRIRLVGMVSDALIASLMNTLIVATAATLVTVAAGLVLAWAGRHVREGARASLGRMLGRIASLGYALPGTVLA
ncbi:MAG: iron ABC transporter permease, partial [Comamonadaceae bacterium]